MLFTFLSDKRSHAINDENKVYDLRLKTIAFVHKNKNKTVKISYFDSDPYMKLQAACSPVDMLASSTGIRFYRFCHLSRKLDCNVQTLAAKKNSKFFLFQRVVL